MREESRVQAVCRVITANRFVFNVLVEQKKLQENIRAERNKLVNAVGT